MYRRMFRLWIFLKSVGLGFQTDRVQGGSGKWMPLPLNIPTTTTSGRELDVVPRSLGSDAAPVVETVDIPAVESMEHVRLSSQPLSGQLSPASA